MTSISRTNALLAAFGFLVASVLIFVFLMKPLYAVIMALRASTEQIVSDVREKEDAVSKIQELVSKYQNLSEIRDLFSQSLPYSIDSAAVTAEANVIAQKNLLAVESVGYEVVPVKPLPDPARNAKYGHGGLIVKVAVVGSYANIKNFILGLESSIRIFDVKSIRLDAGDEKNALANSIKAEIFFATYYQSDQESNPALTNQAPVRVKSI